MLRWAPGDEAARLLEADDAGCFISDASCREAASSRTSRDLAAVDILWRHREGWREPQFVGRLPDGTHGGLIAVGERLEWVEGPRDEVLATLPDALFEVATPAVLAGPIPRPAPIPVPAGAVAIDWWNDRLHALLLEETRADPGESVVFSARGNCYAFSRGDRICWARPGGPLHELAIPRSLLAGGELIHVDVALSPCGTRLAFLGWDQNDGSHTYRHDFSPVMAVFEVPSSNPIAELRDWGDYREQEVEDEVTGMAVSRHNELAWSSSSEVSIGVPGDDQAWETPYTGPTELAFSHDGDRLAIVESGDDAGCVVTRAQAWQTSVSR